MKKRKVFFHDCEKEVDWKSMEGEKVRGLCVLEERKCWFLWYTYKSSSKKQMAIPHVYVKVLLILEKNFVHLYDFSLSYNNIKEVQRNARDIY